VLEERRLAEPDLASQDEHVSSAVARVIDEEIDGRELFPTAEKLVGKRGGLRILRAVLSSSRG
jgi:hypothetical protein